MHDSYNIKLISYFMKNRPVGAYLFIADGQTDRQIDVTELIVAFRKFAIAPNECDDNSASSAADDDDNINNNRLNIYWRIIVKALPKEVRELNISYTGQVTEVAVVNMAKNIGFIKCKRFR